MKWSAGLLALWLLSGCTQKKSASDSSAENRKPETAQVSAPFDVKAIMRQVQLAFRSVDSGWEGGHDTYDVQVSTHGFSVRPRLSPEPRAPPVRFGPARVVRGETVLSTPGGQGQVNDQGQLLLKHGHVTEHFRNRESGVEHAWSFSQRPEGTGDLEVRIPVENARFLGATATGVHFAADTSGAGTVHGHGTWVDARGQRTPVPARFDSGDVVLRVPTDVVETSSWPVMLAPVISPETGVDTPVTAPPPRDQELPAVARGATGFLLVWQDTRMGGSSDTQDIFGTLVDASGRVVHPRGIAISTAKGAQTKPAVAFDGTNFLVVWTDLRTQTSTIYGARVDSSGAVLDPQGIALSGGVQSASAPAVAFDGTNFLAVWQEYRNTLNIRATRISPAGAVLDPAGINVGSGTNSQSAPAVASTGMGFLVVWQQQNSSVDIHGARVSGSGTVLDPSGFAISTAANNQRTPSVAHAGNVSLVVWTDYQGTTADIQGALLSGSEVVRQLPISVGAGNQWAPAVDFDGTDFLVVWKDLRDPTPRLYGTRVDPTGSVRDPSGLVLSDMHDNNSLPLGVAFDGTNHFLVFADNAPSGSKIHGVRLERSGRVLDDPTRVLSTGANEQTEPAVASDGTNFLVVWTDYRHRRTAIHGARVSGTGALLDPNGFALSSSDDNNSAPSVAFNGTTFLVVWSSPWGISVTQVSREGVVLGTPGSLIYTTPFSHSDTNAKVASDGRNFLVAWTHLNPSDGGSVRVYARRLDASGKGISNPFTLAPGNYQSSPSVVFSGTNYLVTWVSTFGGAAGVRIITTDEGLETQAIFQNDGIPSSVQMASDGKELLAVWVEGPYGKPRIVGRRISSTGTVLDASSFLIHETDEPRVSPQVVYDGSNYLVVWQQSVGGAFQVHGARIRATGEVLEPSGFAITDGPTSAQQYELASTGTRRALVVYSRAHFSPDTNITRVMARLVDFGNTAPVATAQDLALDEDEPKALTLSGTDADGDPLTYTVARPPAHGRLSGSAPKLTYTPDRDYNGPDSFTFTATDTSMATSAPATVGLTVRPVNDAPVANAQSVVLDEDVPTAITLSGTDAEADPLTFTVTRLPTRGRLSGSAPHLTYTPDANVSGPDSFAFTVSETAGLTSAPATVSLTVRPVNDVPVALPNNVEAQEDGWAHIFLAGTDVERSSLTYKIETRPAHGTLTGSAQSYLYYPDADYHGPDSLTFTVTDSEGARSAPATVSITVIPVNDAPVANAQSLVTNEDVPLPLTLSGSDVDGDALTYSVDTSPTHGTLSGVAPHLVYQPGPDFHGQDTFSFFAQDSAGARSRTAATVSLTVRPVNDAPVARPQGVSVNEDTAVNLVLLASDVDGDALTYSVVRAPTHGRLSGSASARTYQPEPDYNGPDSFTFTAKDPSGATSSEVTVSLLVVPVNDAPVAIAQALTVDEDGSAAITLVGTDVEGDRLTYEVVQPPVHGLLTGNAPHLTYRPEADYHGPDSFTFLVRDTSGAASAPSTVSLTVTSINDPPVARSQFLSTGQEPTAIQLGAMDPEGDALLWRIETPPEQGRLTGEPPSVLYTPPPDFRGTVHFTFSVSDGQETSAPATVSIEVKNGAPQLTLSASTLRLLEGQPVSFTAMAKDPGGDTLTYDWRFGDGTSSKEPSPTHTYVQDGLYDVVVSVSDGVESATATLSLQVLNAAPRLTSFDPPAPLREGTPAAFRIIAEDPDPLTYTWNFGDGTTSEQGPEVQHTYADDGVYTMTVTVKDDAGASSAISHELTAGNLPPVPEPLSSRELAVGETLRMTFQAQDPAGDRDPLTWTLLEGPGTLTADGRYTWTPSPDDKGDVLVRAQVSDGDGGTAESRLNIQVSRPAGCGCTSTGEAFSLSALLLLMWATRSRQRRAA